MEELKPCPFCGSHPTLIKGQEYVEEDLEMNMGIGAPIYQYVCSNPNCIIFNGYQRFSTLPASALKFWNKRYVGGI